MSSSWAFRSAAIARARLSPHSALSRSTIVHSRPSWTPPLFSRHHSAPAPYRSFTVSTPCRASNPNIMELDQSLSPVTRVMITTTKAVRNILIFSTTTLTLGFLSWTGAHAYLEQYKCPSPAGLSSAAQNCLHGAWIREEISPDPDVAEIYLNKALDLTRSDLETKYGLGPASSLSSSSPPPSPVSALKLEKDKALVEIEHRLARFYARIGQDERAATLWTRLWKLSEKEISESKDEEPTSGGFSLGGLFGAGMEQRPLITKQEGIAFAKHAADCWMRLGEYDLAEEALAWALGTMTQARQEQKQLTTTDTAATLSGTGVINEVGFLSTLGALYVRQAKYQDALSLFVRAMQLVQDHRQQDPQQITQVADIAVKKKEGDMWFCREAILMNSIGETLFAASSSSSSSDVSPPPSQPSQSPVESKKSSWKFWSSSSTSTPVTSKPSTPARRIKSVEEKQKEEEALGWMQKAVSMAKDRSGEHRDCDECAGLALNNLGLISEMEGDKQEALGLFRDAVYHATMAKDYVGIESYNKNVARLTVESEEEPEPVEPKNV